MATTTKAPRTARDATPPAERPTPNPKFDLTRAKRAKAEQRAQASPGGEPVALPPGSNISNDPRLQDLIEKHLAALDKAKALLDEADVLLDMVLQIRGGVKVVQLKQNRVACIVDQFEATNVQWRSHSLRRFVVTELGKIKKSQVPDA